MDGGDVDQFEPWLVAFLKEAAPHDPLPTREAVEKTAAAGDASSGRNACCSPPPSEAQTLAPFVQAFWKMLLKLETSVCRAGWPQSTTPVVRLRPP